MLRKGSGQEKGKLARLKKSTAGSGQAYALLFRPPTTGGEDKQRNSYRSKEKMSSHTLGEEGTRASVPRGMLMHYSELQKEGS